MARVFHTVASKSAVRAGLAALRAGEPPAYRVPPDDELPTTPDEEITTTLDVTAYLPAKVAALRAHATQLTVVDGAVPYFALTNEIAQPIPAADSFVLAHGPAEGAAGDLFGGL